MTNDTLNHFLLSLSALFTAMRVNAHLALLMIAGLWFVHGINYLVHYRLTYLGLRPRRLTGLVGIFCAPFLHGSFNHLFFNSIPLFVLLNFILLQGFSAFLSISAGIIIISQSATWLFGRRGNHIGASSLVMGYWGYLLLDAIQHPSLKTVLLALLALYYFGGLILQLFPKEEKVSFEGHLFGFIAGVLTVFLLPAYN